MILPVSGKLSEQYGCRRVFLGSVVAFTIASLCCGLADNIYVLVALRAAAGGRRSGLHTLGDRDHRGLLRRRARSRGQLVRQYLFDRRDDRAHIRRPVRVLLDLAGHIFWSTRPSASSVIVLALRYVPRDRSRLGGSPPRMDAIGMALLGGGLLAGMLAVSYLGERNAHAWSPAFVIPLAIAIVGSGCSFVTSTVRRTRSSRRA